MPYVLTVATSEERDAVVAALRQAADQRSRVAQQAAGDVLQAEAQAKAAGRRDDLRPAALKVTRFLGEANLLQVIADRFADTPATTLEAKVEVELTNGATTVEELPLDTPAPGKVDTAAGIASAAANIDAAIDAKVADDGPTYDAGADDDEPVEGNDPNPEGE